MKFLFLLIIFTLSLGAWAQDESEEIIAPPPVVAEEISAEKSAEVMESLRKTQKSREEQNKFLEELEISE